MRKIFLLVICFASLHVSAKVGIGAGFDLSPNAARVSIRDWLNKKSGIEIGFGPSAYLKDYIFDDICIQAKYMQAIRYNGYLRTYVGAIARYTFIQDDKFHKNLPSAGAFAGNEWYLGRFRNQGIAIEGGVMYGRMSRLQYVEGTNVSIEKYYKEFPVYLTFSYKYYF